MLQSMLQSLDDPHSRHAILVHFPIVLGALGLIPVLALALRKFDSRWGTAVCVLWFVGAMAGLGLAAGAGEEAYERVEETSPPLSQAEHDALEEHESLGEGAWLWAVPAVLFAGATVIPKKPIRVASGVGLIASAAVLSGFVGVAGHTGGKLVYEHGLGTPPRSAATGAESLAEDRAPASTDDDHDED